MRRPGETHRDACERKRGYRVQQDAAAVLVRMTAQGLDVDGVTAYRCPFCRRWHLGHVPSVESLEAIAREIRGLNPPGQA